MATDLCSRFPEINQKLYFSELIRQTNLGTSIKLPTSDQSSLNRFKMQIEGTVPPAVNHVIKALRRAPCSKSFKMHHRLEIPELLLKIFQLTIYRPVHRPLAHEMTTMAVLARTCRAFSEIALDVMWATRGLDDLVKLLPRDLQEEFSIEGSAAPRTGTTACCTGKSHASETGFQVLRSRMATCFTRPLQKLDGDTLARYSHRMRRISTTKIFSRL